MNIEYLIGFAGTAIKNHPDKKEEIEGLVGLCCAEIELGESAEHEVELCISDIEQLTKK